MIRAGIIGGAGYTAGELIRILVNHPECSISFVHSESNAGKKVADVHEGLTGDTELHFCDSFNLDDIDVLFLCGAHGKSAQFWDEHAAGENLRIIDLAQDFRDESNGYVYGLPEFRKDSVRGAMKVANPGCFATAIQLAILPLASAGILPEDVNVTAITGSTGAGTRPSETTHFSWRNNNISTYKVFEHQHLKEIRRNVSLIQEGYSGRINFVPVRGDFARGIFASVTLECAASEEEIVSIFNDCYSGAPFTFLSGKSPDLKQVVNTNKCLVHVEKHGGLLAISSVIDNLLKGASGQAVQNMNIMFGIDETTGLKLKASAF